MSVEAVHLLRCIGPSGRRCRRSVGDPHRIPRVYGSPSGAHLCLRCPYACTRSSASRRLAIASGVVLRFRWPACRRPCCSVALAVERLPRPGRLGCPFLRAVDVARSRIAILSPWVRVNAFDRTMVSVAASPGQRGPRRGQSFPTRISFGTSSSQAIGRASPHRRSLRSGRRRPGRPTTHQCGPSDHHAH